MGLQVAQVLLSPHLCGLWTHERKDDMYEILVIPVMIVGFTVGWQLGKWFMNR